MAEQAKFTGTFEQNFETFLAGIWEDYQNGEIRVRDGRGGAKAVDGIEHIYKSYSKLHGVQNGNVSKQDLQDFVNALVDTADGHPITVHRQSDFDNKLYSLKNGKKGDLDDYLGADVSGISKDFFHFYNDQFATEGIGCTDRIYINPKNNAAKLKIMKQLIKAMDNDSSSIAMDLVEEHIYNAKVTGPAVNRVDGIVVYVRNSKDKNNVWFADAFAALLGETFKGDLADDLPAIVKKVAKGVGRASDPPNGVTLYTNSEFSFGKFYSDLIWQSLKETSERRDERLEEDSFREATDEDDVKDLANFRTLLHDKMTKLGINVSKPWELKRLDKDENQQWESVKNNQPQLFSINLEDDHETHPKRSTVADTSSTFRELKDTVSYLSRRVMDLEREVKKNNRSTANSTRGRTSRTSAPLVARKATNRRSAPVMAPKTTRKATPSHNEVFWT